MTHTSLHAIEERTLLSSLEGLLDREERCLYTGDADGLFAIALERGRLMVALTTAARARCAQDAGDVDPDLRARYQALLRTHETRGRVVRRFEERTARATGVLAQVAGQAHVYGADGRVAMARMPA